ncbi:NERD domain-containing protein [Patescibacteria group bacterium]|nr:NERD domain-containing protein [Patescibacteria group bacterium]
MPIPSQNEFLSPFLQILSDGGEYTRGQIMFRLAQHFDISEDKAQQMSGHQFTLVSRVAWCDAHFVKAGFVRKTQHSSDNLQDVFRITSLGVRELNKHSDQLTVGYLMSFYRGKVYRGAGADDVATDAELLLAEKFEDLPDAFTVFHSVKWFAKDRGSVGEVDFIIAHPQHGVLVIEVKGEQVSIERGGNRAEWFTTNDVGRTVGIKDPCEQADRNRWALNDWLRADPRTSGYRYAIFPAVALSQSRVEGDIRPDCPANIFIDLTHLDNLEARLLQI